MLLPGWTIKTYSVLLEFPGGEGAAERAEDPGCGPEQESQVHHPAEAS